MKNAYAEIASRSYGVELEFTGITHMRAAEVVAKILDYHGAMNPAYNCYKTRTVLDSSGRR